MMDFVCMADHHYAKWLALSLASIRAAHPDARIFVFDLSPGERAIRACCESFPAAVVVPFPQSDWRWPAWIDGTDFAFFWPRFTARESFKYWGRRLRAAISGRAKEGWMIDKRAHARKMQQFCRIVSLKPHVLGKALQLSGRDIVFIDADAVVRKPLQAVFDQAFDLGVTCEEPAEVVIGPNPAECLERPAYPIRAVNTGVVFLRNNAAARSVLADWIAEMETVRDVSAEQTALANLILRKSGGFFAAPGACSTIRAGDGAEVRVANLPMRLYNCCKLTPGMERLPEGIYVAHFVGALKKNEYWDKARALVNPAGNR